MIDWGDGLYEHTAAELAPAAARAVDAAALAPGERVLDLGCGTGNAALEAARRGARVVGVDPASRLVEVARARADAAAPLDASFVVGEAGAIPADDGAFDAALSVFAVIFAPDAEASVRELARVVRPGGRIVLTTWPPEGAVYESGDRVRQALAAVAPASSNAPALRWGDPAWVTELLARHGFTTTIDWHALAFEAASADAWFATLETYHPFWRAAPTLVGDRWPTVRAEALDVLRARNEDPAAFRVTSRYLQVRGARA